jgi:hypothetical protein
MPARMSAWVFQQVHSQLVFLRDSNCEVFSPNQFAALAATIQILVNGTVCTCRPPRERWLCAYDNDVELCIVCELVLNPSLICNKGLSKVNHNYCGPLRQSQILIEDGMLILHELICISTLYTRLQLVPQEMYIILFYCLPHKCHWWASQRLPHTPLVMPPLLLACNVCLRKVDVFSLPWLCAFQS